MVWSWGGALFILVASWIQVQIDVQINEWFGQFYNTLQQALGKPNSIEINSYYGLLSDVLVLSASYVFVAVLLNFFSKQWTFRWRDSMTIYFLERWSQLRHIEGSSQRVQEDTKRFAIIMESLGANFIESLMVLVAFLPILWELSSVVSKVPFLGEVKHSLIYMTIIFSLIGTLLLSLIGFKLPGLEFNNQRVEAAFRKELVYSEDEPSRGSLSLLVDLFQDVKKNYYRLFFHYLYFDVAKFSYLQLGVILPYLILAPTIVAGAITLGLMQQIIRAFYRVQESFQFLVKSWPTIVELISVYKRLKAFESALNSQIARN